MFQKITPTFLFLVVAVVVWTTAAGLSQYLSGGYGRQHQNHDHATESVPEKIASLRAQVKAAPSDMSAQLALADALIAEAREKNSGVYVLEAIQVLQAAHKVDATHRDVLGRLATACLEFGIIDQAVSYYAQYTEKYPDDKKMKTDYAISLLQFGKAEEADNELQTILKGTPDYFPARLTRALVYRVMNRPEEAKKEASLALTLAPDKEAKLRVEEFLAALDAPTVGATDLPSLSATEERPAEEVSPAMALESYFRNHKIIGPKLKGVTWPEANIARVNVSKFPVSEMPAFARETFERNVKNELKSLPGILKVELWDAETQELLMEIVKE